MPGMRRIIFALLLWTGCTGESHVTGMGDVGSDSSENSVNNTSVNNTAGNNGTGNNGLDSGVPLPDSGLTPDVGPPDTGFDVGPEEPDVGPPDFGNPVFLNPCESGPLELPIADCRPTPLPSTGDDREDCVRRINQFRWECQCLPALTRWREGEACADQQAAFDAQTSTPHNGFSSGVCSPRGFAQNECPRWGSWGNVISGCLQQMWDEGPGEPFSAHGHYINMSSSRYSTVACGVGEGWYVQNFQ